MFRRYVLPTLIWLTYRVLIWTWKIPVHLPESLKQVLAGGGTIIFAHWHGDEMAIIHFVKPFRLATMTSTSKDGQLVDFVIRKLGGATSKGSATRGGSRALRGLVKLMRSGRSASMAVDGPRGPIYEVKAGVFTLSLLSKSPIYPVGVAVDRFHRFEKSWNKAILPKPFATVAVHVGEGLTVTEKPDEVRTEELAAQLSDGLKEAKRLAEVMLESEKGGTR